MAFADIYKDFFKEKNEQANGLNGLVNEQYRAAQEAATNMYAQQLRLAAEERRAYETQQQALRGAADAFHNQQGQADAFLELKREREKMEAPFTEEELKTGRANELRAIRAPAPGATVEVGFILTDIVLVVNKLVEIVQSLQEENEVLKTRLKFHKQEPEEPFKLKSIESEYDEDLEP